MSSYSSFPEFVRALKERNDIVEVIGSYIKLERRGSSNLACCPFHHEKTPSFSVNAVDQYYHCFGCQASGDVIGFVKAYENVDFMQAVQILATRAGMEIPSFDNRDAEEAARKKKYRDRLSSLMRDTARFYLNNLYSGKADAYLEYLTDRGIKPSTMKKFGLGASLDYNGLPSYLLAHGYSAEECTDSGACARTQDGKLIDAEGGRLIIPIINHFDEVIAFGGRVMHPTDRAKYKNTRETMLFNKSKTLFNINLIKKEKRAGAVPNLIMVEGYMDAISLYQAGFPNVVASMGTSLTKDQARLCKRYTDNVLISYDGDFAGQSANLRGLDILRDEGLKVRVVPMPEGLDPDDVVKKRGQAGYRACLDAAMPLIDFRLLAVQRKHDLSDPYERREYVKEALAVVKDAESATVREELLGRIASLSGVSVSALARDLEQGGGKAAASEPAAPRPSSEKPQKKNGANAEIQAARFVLAACLLSKPYAAGCDLSARSFADEEHRTVAAYIIQGRKDGRVRPSELFDRMDADGELSEILNLDYGDNLDGSSAEKYFNDCLCLLDAASLSASIAAEREKYKTASEEERREIIQRINEYTKRKNSLKKQGGGRT